MWEWQRPGISSSHQAPGQGWRQCWICCQPHWSSLIRPVYSVWCIMSIETKLVLHNISSTEILMTSTSTTAMQGSTQTFNWKPQKCLKCWQPFKKIPAFRLHYNDYMPLFYVSFPLVSGQVQHTLHGVNLCLFVCSETRDKDLRWFIFCQHLSSSLHSHHR